MAEIKFYSDLSLMGGASIKNLRVENLPTASIPASGVDGQMVFDTDLNVLKFWDGTEWAAIQNDADLEAAITSLEGRMDEVESAVVAAQGDATQALADAATAQGTADLAETHAADAQTRVGVLEPQVAQVLIDVVTAQSTADLAETHAADAQTRVGALEAQNLDSRLAAVEADDAGDDADIAAAQAAADAAQGTADQAVLDAAAAQGTADLAETHAADAQTRVGVLEGQNLDSRLAAVEADDAGDDADIAAAQAAADAAQGTADQAVLDAAQAQATADLAETHAADAQERVGVLEPQVAQLLVDVVTAQSTADLAETHAVDAQTRVGVIEAEDFPTRVVALENSAIDHEGRLDAIETAPYASEGFVTGITDALDGRIDAIESAPYASEAYADQAAAGAVDAHNLDTDAHPMGIKWFTPTALINGPITYPGAPQSGVSLTTGGISVSSLGGSDPLGWLEFEGQITVSGTGSVTLDVDIDAELYGVVAMPQLTLNRGEATAFRYMVQAPVTGVAQEYDLIFKTVSGTETADFSPISIDAFGSDPFVLKSELDAVDDRVTAIETAPYSYNLDFTITGDDVETEFTSSAFAGDIYPAVSVWEDATGSLVLVDVARAYSAGPDTTTLTISFNEAPADGATYRVAVKA